MTGSSAKSVLARITTQWSLVTNPVQFVARYAPAIQRYLEALIRDPHDSADAAQEFLAKVSNKGFERLALDRGRFRDYLIVAVRNTAFNVLKKKKRFRGLETTDAEPVVREDLAAAADASWLAEWRKCVLERAFRELFQHERKSPGNLFHTVLKLKSDRPETDDAELAAVISAKTGKTLRPDAFRKQLSRARRRFAELIVAEVAETLEQPTPESVEEELIDTGLMEFVRPFLPADWRTSGALTEEE